jgi:protoporphyrinogen/coproporphyrinogen III oxidase
MTSGDAPKRPRVVVVGGGISGLAAALSLADESEVTLFEASASIGGLIRTTEFHGQPLDAAADVFVTRTPDAENLALALGLGDELVPPATSAASVFARGALRPLPKGLFLGVPTDLGALWRSRIVSPRSVVRAMGDLIGAGATHVETDAQSADPTIAEVFEPRLGREIFTNLIDPVLGGINAGDARALSLAATAPTIAEATSGKASLIRALRPLARRVPADGISPMFLGLAKGMATLTDRLARECVRRGVTIESSTNVRSMVATEGGSIRVDASRGTIGADGVLVALPAWAAAPLVRPMSAALANELGAIPYASVATISLSYVLGDQRTRPPLTGSGMLIPRGDALCTALTFVSRKWPRRTDDQVFVIRASVGRHGDERALELDDEELSRRVHAEIETMLRIATPPSAVRVERFVDAFPQYVSGHLARRDRIAQLTAGLGAVAITGSWAAGIGIPACIASARAAAGQVTDRLR